MTVIRGRFGSETTETRWAAAEDAFAAGDAGSALGIFADLADKGEWLAYVEVGNLLEMGPPGVEKNIERALYWYRKAVFESDDPNAHFALARLYFNGQETSLDHTMARHHVEKALSAPAPYQLSDHYRAMAYVMLGNIHARGLGVAKDVKKARQALEEGTEAGYLWPMFELSNLELRSWHFFKGLRLRFRASRIAGSLLTKNPNDPRLIGLNVPQALKRRVQATRS